MCQSKIKIPVKKYVNWSQLVFQWSLLHLAATLIECLNYLRSIVSGYCAHARITVLGKNNCLQVWVPVWPCEMKIMLTFYHSEAQSQVKNSSFWFLNRLSPWIFSVIYWTQSNSSQIMSSWRLELKKELN